MYHQVSKFGLSDDDNVPCCIYTDGPPAPSICLDSKCGYRDAFMEPTQAPICRQTNTISVSKIWILQKGMRIHQHKKKKHGLWVMPGRNVASSVHRFVIPVLVISTVHPTLLRTKKQSKRMPRYSTWMVGNYHHCHYCNKYTFFFIQSLGSLIVSNL